MPHCGARNAQVRVEASKTLHSTETAALGVSCQVDTYQRYPWLHALG